MNTQPFIRPHAEFRRSDPCLCASGLRFKQCCGSMASDRPPPAGVLLERTFLDAETCRDWVGYFQSQRRAAQLVKTPGEAGDLARRQHDIRITDDIDAGELRQAIDAAVMRAFQTVAAARFGRRFAWCEQPQVLGYKPGGRYLGHADSEVLEEGQGVWRKVADRDISLLLYLDEDFEGGHLRFHYFNYEYRPRTGDLVAFPSDGRYAHMALPVTRGERHVIVSWAAFTDEPRVFNAPPADSLMFEEPGN